MYESHDMYMHGYNRTEGPLTAAMVTKGSADDVPGKLKQAGLKAVLVYPDARPGVARTMQVPSKSDVKEVVVLK